MSVRLRRQGVLSALCDSAGLLAGRRWRGRRWQWSGATAQPVLIAGGCSWDAARVMNETTLVVTVGLVLNCCARLCAAAGEGIASLIHRHRLSLSKQPYRRPG